MGEGCARLGRAERAARARCAQPGDACPIGRRTRGPRCPPSTVLAGASVPERRDGWFSAGASLQLLPPSVIGWPPHILASAIDGLSPQAPSARFASLNSPPRAGRGCLFTGAVICCHLVSSSSLQSSFNPVTSAPFMANVVGRECDCRRTPHIRILHSEPFRARLAQAASPPHASSLQSVCPRGAQVTVRSRAGLYPLTEAEGCKPLREAAMGRRGASRPGEARAIVRRSPRPCSVGCRWRPPTSQL